MADNARTIIHRTFRKKFTHAAARTMRAARTIFVPPIFHMKVTPLAPVPEISLISMTPMGDVSIH